MKKILSLAVIFLVGAAFLASQSLVELSKQEKERREKLKGKAVRLVTNEDLKKIKRTPAVSTPGLQAEGQQGQEAAASPPPSEPGAEAGPSEEETTPAGREAYIPYFATAVLPDTFLVENPEAALNFPDGRYAEISVFGSLDLAFFAENGPGEDIAIYARLAGAEELAAAVSVEEGLPVGPEWQWPDKMTYGVLALGESGEWEDIGVGTGETRPEKFDLGEIRSTKMIRIVFRYQTSPGVITKPLRATDREITFGIDAVEALN